MWITAITFCNNALSAEYGRLHARGLDIIVANGLKSVHLVRPYVRPLHGIEWRREA